MPDASMPEMLAVRLYGPSDLRVEQVPHPGSPGRGEVLLRITATGVCGSDLHPYETGTIGSTVLESALTLGHEFAGVVEAVGEGTSIAIGTRVAVDPLINCGHCDGCEGGNPNLCRQQSFAGLWPKDGSLSQWMLMPERNCFPISDSLTDAEAALLEPLGIALHATDLARIRVGSSVAIFGAGSIGLCLTQTVKLAGASPVYITDPLGWRVKAAQKLGAVPLPEKVEVDVAIEAAWARESVQQAMDALRPGGTLVLVGIPFEDHVEFKHSTARRKGLTIMMCRRMKRVYPRTIHLVENGLVDLKSLITHRYPLTEVPEAFRMNAAYENEVVKTIIDYPQL
jgi:L-iditol 2-dehydrogenase